MILHSVVHYAGRFAPFLLFLTERSFKYSRLLEIASGELSTQVEKSFLSNEGGCRDVSA